jgi:glutathione peroxidase-family protein
MHLHISVLHMVNCASSPVFYAVSYGSMPLVNDKFERMFKKFGLHLLKVPSQNFTGGTAENDDTCLLQKQVFAL